MSKVQDVVTYLALPATPTASAALPLPVVAGTRSADGH
jgi:hypothetical protein